MTTKILMLAAPVVALMLFPDLVLAAAAAVTDAAPTLEDAPGLIQAMVEAFQSGNIPLAIGSLALLLALLVGAVNAFMSKMTAIAAETRKAVLPWLVAAGGCLTAFGLALIAGVGWLNAVLAGLVTSAAATGLWELVIKVILKAVNKKTAAPPPAEG